MERPKLGIGAKILVVVIAAAVVWLAVSEIREAARVNRIAALPACGIVAEYVEWRLAFEDRHPAPEATSSSAAAEFELQNERFERAVRKAREESDAAVLEALENITAIDSEPWIRERSDLAPFVQIVLAECRDQVEPLLRGSQQ